MVQTQIRLFVDKIIISHVIAVDISECNNIYCHHHCNNTEGSYYCYCDTGYELLNDSVTCSGQSIVFVVLIKINIAYRY